MRYLIFMYHRGVEELGEYRDFETIAQIRQCVSQELYGRNYRVYKITNLQSGVDNMPDIAMCQDDECPKAAECFRHQFSGTKPSSYQSFFMESPRETDTNECEYFWKRIGKEGKKHG
jgi:hypothetical protein